MGQAKMKRSDVVSELSGLLNLPFSFIKIPTMSAPNMYSKMGKNAPVRLNVMLTIIECNKNLDDANSCSKSVTLKLFIEHFRYSFSSLL